MNKLILITLAIALPLTAIADTEETPQERDKAIAEYNALVAAQKADPQRLKAQREDAFLDSTRALYSLPEGAFVRISSAIDNAA